MKVKFYGVRGSIASAGEETRRYGGNTSCVAVTAGSQQLVFDAGTGIRKLATDLGPTPVPVHLFFSHLHWDHIQGFPFFTPAFVPGNEVHLYGVDVSSSGESDRLRTVLANQMKAPTFPVGLDVMQADLRFNDVPESERISVGQVQVRHTAVDHPNGCVAYRVDFGGKSVVYATDVEHGPESNERLIELAQGCDLLIYDAMYTPEEYAGEKGPSRVGWGHSTYVDGAHIARAARARSLCLFHHDPSHDDAFMDGLAERGAREFASTVVAKEGLEIDLAKA